MVRFLAVQRDDVRGVLALVMDYVAGESLDARLRRLGRVEEREVIAIDPQSRGRSRRCTGGAGTPRREAGERGRGRVGLQAHRLRDRRRSRARGGGPAARRDHQVAFAPECVERGAPPAPTANLYALGVTSAGWSRARCQGRAARRRRCRSTPAPRAPTRARRSRPPAYRRRRRRGIEASLRSPRRPDRQARRAQSAGSAAARGLGRALDELRRGRRDEPEEPPLPVARTWRMARRRPAISRPRRRSSVAIARWPRRSRAPPARYATAPACDRDGRAAGIGRTRLLEEAIAAARFPAGRVLHARCSPERQSVLQPWRGRWRRSRPIARGRSPRSKRQSRWRSCPRRSAARARPRAPSRRWRTR